MINGESLFDVLLSTEESNDEKIDNAVYENENMHELSIKQPQTIKLKN